MSTEPSPPPARRAAFAVLLGGVGLAATTLITVLPAIDTVPTWGWRPVPCTVRALSVAEVEAGWEVHTRFSYVVDGTAYTGHTYGLGPGTRDWADDAVAAHPPGPDTCWRAPTAPDRAVLDRGGGWRTALGLAGVPVIVAAVAGALPPRVSERGRRVVLLATATAGWIATLSLVLAAGGPWDPVSVGGAIVGLLVAGWLALLTVRAVFAGRSEAEG